MEKQQVDKPRARNQRRHSKTVAAVLRSGIPENMVQELALSTLQKAGSISHALRESDSGEMFSQADDPVESCSPVGIHKED